MPFVVTNYLDDLLFIPILMGISLQFQQFLVNRDFAFSAKQIIYTWLYTCFVFEIVFPSIILSYTADFYDAIAYGFGGIFFYKMMNYPVVNSKV